MAAADERVFAQLAPRIARERRDGVEIVRLGGELDLHAAPALEEAFEAAASESSRVVVDLTEVEFFDSSALGAVLTLRRRLLHANGRLGIVVAGLESPRVFRVTGLDQVLPLTATLEGALEAVKL